MGPSMNGGERASGGADIMDNVGPYVRLARPFTLLAPAVGIISAGDIMAYDTAEKQRLIEYLNDYIYGRT